MDDVCIQRKDVGSWLVCFVAAFGLMGYVGSYAFFVHREMVPGSLGAFAWPSYTGNVDVDIILNRFFYPIHLADATFRPDYWAYKSYRGN